MEVKINIEQLAGLLDKPQDELTEAFKEGDAGEKFSELFIDRMKSEVSNAREQQYNRALKEVLTKKEREIADAYGLEPTKIDDLIGNIIESKKSELEKELSNKFDKTPEIEELQRKFQQSIQEKESLIEELNTKIKEQESNFQRANLEREVMQQLPDLLREQKFVIPEGRPGQNALKAITQEIVNHGRLTDQGIQIVDEDGNPLRKDFKDVTLNSFASEKAKDWLIQAKADDRKGTGVKTQPPGSVQDGAVFKFEKKDPALLASKLREVRLENKDDPAKARALMVKVKEAYEAADAE